jgi:hypothetical protein
MQALFDAVDAERLERGLTWAALVGEINAPFAGTSSIPISASTVRGMAKKSSVTSAVVLQALRWLRRTPESFLSGGTAGANQGEALPEPGASRILRFDTRSMYEALDAERARLGMTWKRVAGELRGFSENMLRNLATGPLIGFPRVMMIPQWLSRSAASFVRTRNR